jgi:hypothetical protein
VVALPRGKSGASLWQTAMARSRSRSSRSAHAGAPWPSIVPSSRCGGHQSRGRRPRRQFSCHDLQTSPSKRGGPSGPVSSVQRELHAPRGGTSRAILVVLVGHTLARETERSSRCRSGSSSSRCPARAIASSRGIRARGRDGARTRRAWRVAAGVAAREARCVSDAQRRSRALPSSVPEWRGGGEQGRRTRGAEASSPAQA